MLGNAILRHKSSPRSTVDLIQQEVFCMCSKNPPRRRQHHRSMNHACNLALPKKGQLRTVQTIRSETFTLASSRAFVICYTRRHKDSSLRDEASSGCQPTEVTLHCHSLENRYAAGYNKQRKQYSGLKKNSHIELTIPVSILAAVRKNVNLFPASIQKERGPRAILRSPRVSRANHSLRLR